MRAAPTAQAAIVGLLAKGSGSNSELKLSDTKPAVILVVGVNGAGKVRARAKGCCAAACALVHAHHASSPLASAHCSMRDAVRPQAAC